MLYVCSAQLGMVRNDSIFVPPPHKTKKMAKSFVFQCVVFISLLVFFCLLADSQAWWSRRIPSRIGGYRRYGRSDPDVAQGGKQLLIQTPKGF